MQTRLPSKGVQHASSGKVINVTSVPRPSSNSLVPSPSQRGERVIANQKGNFADDLLDYVTAGPKMRKWYGQAERPTEGSERPPEDEPEPEEEFEGDGDAVLVTDADTPVGELVVLQLILARVEIKVLVKDTVAAKTAYGPYVTPISINTDNAQQLKKALKGCGSVVCLGRPGALAAAAKEAGVSHVLMLSGAGTAQQGGFLSGLFDGELSALRDPAREDTIRRSGRRHTIVRVGQLKDMPGGQSSITFQAASAGAPAPSQPVSREDLAAVIIQALMRPPATGSRVFQVLSQPGSPPSDWSPLFGSLEPEPATA